MNGNTNRETTIQANRRNTMETKAGGCLSSSLSGSTIAGGTGCSYRAFNSARTLVTMYARSGIRIHPDVNHAFAIDDPEGAEWPTS